MNNVSVSKFAKYTTYEISALVKKEIDQNKDITISYLNREILDSILNEQEIFTVEMYEMASEILKIPYDELTCVQTENIEKKYRKTVKCNLVQFQEETEFINQLFEFIIYNDKVNKNI